MKTGVKLGLGAGVMAILMLGHGQAALAQGQPQHADTFIFVQDADPGAGDSMYDTVLDALNDAKYVEPALPNLLKPGQDRETLRGRRNNGYKQSQSAPLTGSATTLDDVVVRPITLEGQDVRTQERADAYAKEVVRQRQLASVIEKLCREAFGSEECLLDPNKLRQNPEALKQRERAFVTDPLAVARIPIENGALAVLDSGTDAYQKKAKQILREAERGGPVNPLAYSYDIAEVRLILEQEENSAAYNKFNEIVEDIKTQITGKPLDTEAYALAIRAASGGKLTLQESARVISAGIDIEGQLKEIASQATERVIGQIGETVVDSAIPDRAQVARPGYNRDQYGEIRIVDTAPANVKVGLQRELLPLLAQAIANPAFVDPAQVENPNLAALSAPDTVDAQGNPAPLTIGQPLQSFENADIIEKGLYEQSGVTQQAGLPGLNALQKVIPDILKKIRR